MGKKRLMDTTVIDPAELVDIDSGPQVAAAPTLGEVAKQAAASIFGKDATSGQAPGKEEKKKPAAPSMEELIRKGLEFAKNRADTPAEQASLASLLGSTR